MVRGLLPLGIALLSASGVAADSGPASCSLTNKCPQETPCCSQYGQCGVGAYCLGGCDPRMSFSLDSCAPEPVCQNRIMPMTDTSRIVDIGKYLGDPSKADWVSQGEPVAYENSVLLTMPANSAGTVLASTVYMWYGTVSAKLKTSRGAGVVTAFILLSDVKDEIDYEFVGTELDIAQTNYYFQGIPDYDNSANISLSDTYQNWHTYEIQWTPDSITWLVDGQVGRTKKRSDTWNATSNQWDFPQSPARVQLSIWPGGSSQNAPGTVQWAGGPIDWNSPDIKNYGYDFATFGQVEIQCYNATSPPGTNTGTSYTYDNVAGTNSTVVDGDKGTILSSFTATGSDMTAGAPQNSTSSSNASSVAAPSQSGVNFIPGGTASGPGQDPGQGSSDGSGSSGSSGSGSSGSGTSGGDSGSGSGTGSSPACSATGFSQNCGSSSGSSGGKSDGARVVGQERLLGTSVFGMVVAVAALMWL